MYQPIHVIPGSNLHRTCIELYQRHANANDGSGRCAACAHQSPCPVRQHAALVIRAAGEDPRWYDGQVRSGQHPGFASPQANQRRPSHPRQPAADLPSQAPARPVTTQEVVGYAICSSDVWADVPAVDSEQRTG
jgi:hypothetical protein